MEEGKYLKPHLSYSFDRLAIHLMNEVEFGNKVQIQDEKSVAIGNTSKITYFNPLGFDGDKISKRSPSGGRKEIPKIPKINNKKVDERKRVQSQPSRSIKKTKPESYKLQPQSVVLP